MSQRRKQKRKLRKEIKNDLLSIYNFHGGYSSISNSNIREIVIMFRMYLKRLSIKIDEYHINNVVLLTSNYETLYHIR